MKPTLIHLASLCVTAALHAQSTIDSVNAYGYGGNVGWINLRPSPSAGVITGCAFFSGYAWSANTGWINFGSGSPANGYAYGNGSAADFGVNQDSFGNLGGFAWAANTGWINFGWAGVDDVNRPRIDLRTGQFAGYAWSANVGWINLGSGYLATNHIAVTDTNNNGIDDAWEFRWLGDLTAATAASDHDNDGRTDLAEFLAGTNPLDPASNLRIVSHNYSADYGMVTIQFTSSPARLYQIQHTTDLTSWVDSGLGSFSPDAGLTTTRSVTYSTTTQHFFRVVPLLPLP